MFVKTKVDPQTTIAATRFCLTALNLLNNLKKPLTSGPAVQGNHGNLSCPAEEKNKIPGFDLSCLRTFHSFTSAQ